MNKDSIIYFRRYGFDKLKIEKRKALMQKGVDPYPYSYYGSMKIIKIINQGNTINSSSSEAEANSNIVGRIWSKRIMGKSIFMDLRDSSGKIQIYFQKNNFSSAQWEIITLLDMGDILGVEGYLFKTKVGELTVQVTRFALLAKSVVSIPVGKEVGDKTYYQALDKELKYRERYINWLLDWKESNKINIRARVISIARKIMESNGFLEVSAPTIEFIYGGAEARPFKTSIWAHGEQEAFLRISPELYLKRYIVAGFDKVFTICKNFRNEGIDRAHHPEFTMMEWYEAFTDYKFQMRRFEDLIAYVCKEIHGTTEIEFQGYKLDFTPPWRRLTVLEALLEYTGIDASSLTLEELEAELEKREISCRKPISWGIAVMELFEALCEEHLIQPTIIYDYPIEISPLTKIKRGDNRFVERFEAYVSGMEMSNAYSELTDPIEQLKRLVSQRELQNGEVDFTNHPIDTDFIKSMGYGMPPTGGVGVGIDRLVMLMTNSPNIRDIIPFPMIKPKNYLEKNTKKKGEKNETKCKRNI